MRAKAANVDGYIAGFPPATRAMLEKMRETIRKAAPNAEEGISYAIPSYKLNGMLVSFAGYAGHIGFYPGAGGIAEFIDEISHYRFAKGSVQFPLDKPLPLRLIKLIVKFRVRQNLERTKKTEK
jgi:uncharacterized protein YdhG (YjbR/CyaY superfamily)